MLHFLPQDDYTLVIPGPDDHNWYRGLMDYGLESNAAFLAALAEPPRGGRITGTFIYSHPPDYVGRNTMGWGVSEWRALMDELKEMGVDTLIHQAAAWAEVRECNYPSKLLSDFKTWDSLTPLCEAAAAEGMTLYLGGLGNLMAFDEHATWADLQRDLDGQLAVFDELLALYRGGFQGYYMSPETGFPGQRQPEREQLLNRYFREMCAAVKARLPGIPILASPGTFYFEDREEEIYQFLVSLFDGVPIDYMTPQDSIGTFGNRLAHLKPSFELWQRVCRATGMRLWVNAESFERVKIGTSCDFVPADFTRLAVQLANAHQVGEKIVSWEVPYFYSVLAGEAGVNLRRAYLASIAAGER